MNGFLEKNINEGENPIVVGIFSRDAYFL